MPVHGHWFSHVHMHVHAWLLAGLDSAAPSFPRSEAIGYIFTSLLHNILLLGLSVKLGPRSDELAADRGLIELLLQ